MTAVIRVLDITQVVILEGVSAGVGTVVDSDVSVVTVGLGCIKEGQELNWGIVGQRVSVCHHF